jgi:hypothetical protein
MSLPILGRKQRDLASEKAQEEEFKFQKESSELLSRWEIENEIIVLPRLISPATSSSITFQAKVFFKKMNNDELNNYKISVQDGSPES